MTPSDQTSLRASTSFALFTCSGDMYPGEPMRDPSAVRLCASTPVAGAFEMPKSSTFTSTESSMRRVAKRFAGLRSRCTMPSACASATASHAWRTRPATAGTGIGPSRRRTSERSMPTRYSMTMYGAPFSSAPTSRTRATCSLVSATAARASRRKR